MSVVRRTKEGIDILEHAMQGVRTSENRSEIVSFHDELGLVGIRSKVDVHTVDTPVEHEVIVKMRRIGDRRRR